LGEAAFPVASMLLLFVGAITLSIVCRICFYFVKRQQRSKSTLPRGYVKVPHQVVERKSSDDIITDGYSKRKIPDNLDAIVIGTPPSLPLKFITASYCREWHWWAHLCFLFGTDGKEGPRPGTALYRGWCNALLRGSWI
jgi:hypothetical protein